MWDISLLRGLALVVGVILILAALRSLRSHRAGRTGVVLKLGVGVASVGLGLFPNMANLPADLLSLEQVPGGRLLTVLILTSVVLLQRVISLTVGQAKLQRNFSHLLQAEMTNTFVREYGRDEHQAKTIALLPCFNEAENLRELLPAMPREVAGLPLATLVIDDGSTDKSNEIARQYGAMVVSHPANLGGGRALHTGFAIAKAMGASFVITLDADGQHDPAQIERLVRPLVDGEADLVIGSRVLGEHDAASQLRTLGVGVFSWLLSRLTAMRITDCASGFRAFDARVLGSLRLQQEQYHTAEMIIEACKAGLRVVERSITIRRRMHGTSKKGHDLLYGYRFAKVLAKSWLR